MKRRGLLAAAFAVAGARAASWDADALGRLDHEAPHATSALRAELHRLVDDGEALLASGDADAALAAFEQVAAFAHAGDVEVAIVRCHMQSGGYERALGHAAHAAAHTDNGAGAALHAWLLGLGDQARMATRTLDAADRVLVGDATLRAARAALSLAWPRADTALLEAPLRLAPYAWGDRAAGARACATALLASDGRHALAPAAAIGDARRVWLRNGLGRTVAVDAAERGPADGIVRLRLRAALPVPATAAGSTRAPFAGSPGSIVRYAPGADAEAAWPLLRSGFFGRERLGVAELPDAGSALVFDGGGRLAGLATGASGDARLLPVAALGTWAPAPEAQAGSRQPASTTYETAMKLALQVLRAD